MNSTFQKGFEKLGKCQISGCPKKGEHRHHRFPNTKVNRALYGSLMDDRRNVQTLCMDDHLNGYGETWSEEEFCEAVGVPVQSKSGQMRAMREASCADQA